MHKESTMANRPLYIPSTATSTDMILQEFTDAQMGLISHGLRQGFVDHVNGNTNSGALFTSSSSGGFGSMTDTSHGVQSNSGSGNNQRGIQGSDFPNAPGPSTSTNIVYAYQSSSNAPTQPTDFSNSYLRWNGNPTVAGMSVARTTAEFQPLFTKCLADMKTGDELGSYHVFSGNAATVSESGTWTRQRTWFTDTRYATASVEYSLYLKTAVTTPSGLDHFCSLNGTDIVVTESLTDLVTLLTPVFINWLTSVNRYDIGGSGTIKGTATDTQFSGSSTSTGQSGGTYTTTSTPSGSITSTNYILRML